MELLSEALRFASSYKIHIGIWIFALTIMAIRSLYWLYVPAVICETCEHAAKAKRIVRGTIAVELIVLAHGLTIGLIFMELLWFTIIFFLWRTLGSYLTCAKCGSERIFKEGTPLTEQPLGESPSVAVIPKERQEKWWY